MDRTPAHNQTQLRADVYELELPGILALQGGLARKVAGPLALKLLPAEQARLANLPERSAGGGQDVLRDVRP